MTQPAPKVFYVTVQQTETLTYRVTTEVEGVTDEDSAAEFIQQADIETLDDHFTHRETSKPETIAVEEVHERPV